MTNPAIDTLEELPTQLARSQRARRERILAAVLELAREGGYDAVQVREVAARAGVALRTIYNYFVSRENLLYEAMIEWRRRVSMESVARVTGTTLEERALSLLRHNFEVFAEAPLLFEAFSRLDIQPGEHDEWTVKVHRSAMEEVLADAGVDADFAADFELILGRFVYADVTLAAKGHLAIEDAWIEIERVVRRLAASQPGSGSRGKK